MLNHEFYTILIAEDSPTQAENLRYALNKAGFGVVMAENGREALFLAQERLPDLVISDIVMPEMTGYELCRALKASPDLNRIPVILLTSLSDTIDVLDGIDCGAEGFLTKPFNEKYLLEHIELTLNNKAAQVQRGERVEVGLKFSGVERRIGATPQQMLSLLLSTYDAAVRRNLELSKTEEELRILNQHLELIVEDRTVELVEENAVRRKAEERLIKLNKIYAFLSYVNQSIVRISEPNHLLMESCRIAVQRGGFAGARVLLLDPSDDSIKTVYQSGNLRFNDFNPISDLQVQLAVDERIFISNNIPDEKELPEDWKHFLQDSGYLSIGFFPISLHTRNKGSLCFCSVEPDFFQEGEKDLLIGLAADISFALDYMHKEAVRMQSEARKGLTTKILTILNRPNEWQQLIRDIIEEIQQFTGIESLGLRLRDGDDFPYFETKGFSSHFLESENSVCQGIEELGGSNSSLEKYSYKGLCGLVLTGKIDRNHPNCSEKGSFWINDYQSKKQGVGKEPVGTVCQFCQKSGYDSIALIPIRTERETIGLLQLNDRREGQFSKDLIEFLEQLALTLGIAFKRVSSEIQIKDSEERYRSLAQSANDAIITMDQNGVVMGWNLGAQKIFGFSAEEIIGHELNLIMPSEYRELHKIAAERAKNDPSHLVTDKTVKLRGKHKSGKEFPIELSLAEWQTVSGHFYSGIIRDITEHEQAKIELSKAKDRAEESDRLKSAFLANMSHEIRTPMNGILGFTGLLKEAELTGEDQSRYISIIEKSGERLLNIINDIISISRIEAGQTELQTSVTNMNEQVEFIYNFFQPEADKKGLKLLLGSVLPPGEEKILVDKEKIYAVLTNLVKNALKFTSSGSIQIDCKRVDQFVEICVSDTGIGIKESAMETIFERFQQASDFLTRKYEGAGLGLSISKAYVEMLGGAMWAESQEGKGSRFYFSIPYVAAD